MQRTGLISKHIILHEYNETKFAYPLCGIILLEDEFIKDIIIIDPNIPASEIIEKYSDWNPLDYSDYYISPGIIDLNARIEWDSFENLTNEAVKGGISLLIVEPGYYQPFPSISSLYCDVGLVKVVDDHTVFDNISTNICALKAYLYSPASNVKSVVNVNRIIQEAHKQNITLIIDPTLPDSRMLYMASPLRHENIENRLIPGIAKPSMLFAGGFPWAMNHGSDSDSDSGKEIPLITLKTNFLQAKEPKLGDLHRKSNSDEDITANLEKVWLDEMNIEEEKEKDGSHNFIRPYRKLSYDIHYELDDRIKKNSENIEDLCTAVSKTYLGSGDTKFKGSTIVNSSSVHSLTANEASPYESNKNEKTEIQKNIPNPLENNKSINGRRAFRPPPIQIATVVKPDIAMDYSYCLANYPEQWECVGIENILKFLQPEHKVHFANISSAGALNRVRKGKEELKGITCEIPAAHLCFTSASVAIGDTRFKNTPPIRNQGNCNCLWDLLKIEEIDCVSSQHASIEPSRKLNGNFQQALNGISSIGCSLQAVWNTLNIPVTDSKHLENYIVKLSKWFSLFPAKVLNINDKRGSIDKGKYADLFIWNPYEKYVVSNEYKYSDTSPFKQQDAMGRIVRVYVRGKIAFDEGICNAVGKEISR